MACYASLYDIRDDFSILQTFPSCVTISDIYLHSLYDIPGLAPLELDHSECHATSYEDSYEEDMS